LRLAKLPSGHAALKQLIKLAIGSAFALGKEEEEDETGEGGKGTKEQSCLSVPPHIA
jgi:hypothetical protein